MCFTCYDFSFKKVFNVVYNCMYPLEEKKSFVTYFQELDAVFVNSHVNVTNPIKVIDDA